jgi:hypothetical protein
VSPTARVRSCFGHATVLAKPVRFSKEGSIIVSSRRFASFIFVAGALSLACGARSGLECFGESCSRPGDDEDGQQGLEPPDGDAPSIDPTPAGGVGSNGSGGRPDVSPSFPVGPAPPDTSISVPDTSISVPDASFCSPGGTFSGPIDVSDEPTLEALRGCGVIDGDLTIFGSAISDLEPLRQLRMVTRELRITSFTGSIEGLDGLQSVDELTIQNTSISSLEPLRNLSQIGNGTAWGGTLDVSQNPGLSSLSGLGNLRSLANLRISENPALTTLAGLNVPAQLDIVSLRNNPLLVDLAGLETLQLAQAFEIDGSPLLASLAPLANLQGAEALALVNLPSLTELNLPIFDLNVLHLENVGVTTLNGLSGLRRLEKATIQNNPSLVDIDRLGPLTLTELSVLNNPSLVRLPDFGAVINVNQVYVRNNAALATGPGYPLAEEAGTITITENPSLTHLTGFSILQRARSIDISRNPSLVEVALGTLGSARNVRITCNPALPEASLEPVLNNVAGTVDVWGNQGSPTPCLSDTP